MKREQFSLVSELPLKRKWHSFWLARQLDGSYMLTAGRPILAKVRGTDSYNFYVPPGDPIGLRHWCAMGVKTVFNVDIKPLQMIRVRVLSDVIGDPIDPKPQDSVEE